MPANETLSRQRVTQGDVARIAGVHNTTVSLSLRNCPSIPEATRTRIRAIADNMGYYPDPTLQALVAYRKGRLANRPRETIAYLTNWGTRWGWRDVPAHARAYAGALKKATELGYQMEHFWLGEPGMNQRRMGQMLFHRGIVGVLVAAHHDTTVGLAEIDWTRLSAVAIGDFLHAPALHRVLDDHGGGMRLALRNIRTAGFARVGFVISQKLDNRADQAWNAGFLMEQGSIEDDKRIPLLRMSCARDESGELASFEKWYQEFQPDVIIGHSPAVLAKIRRLGLEVPGDLAYVDLSLETTDFSVAGVRQNREMVGGVAAAMLVGQLRQNICGIPAVGTSTMVDGSWVDGASLAKVSSRLRSVLSPRLFESTLLEPV